MMRCYVGDVLSLGCNIIAAVRPSFETLNLFCDTVLVVYAAMGAPVAKRFSEGSFTFVILDPSTHNIHRLRPGSTLTIKQKAPRITHFLPF